MKENLVYVVSIFLKHLGVMISDEYVVEKLKSNPYYPTLRCISDFFNEASIDFRILKLTRDELISTNMPCIIHIKDKRQRFLFF